MSEAARPVRNQSLESVGTLGHQRGPMVFTPPEGAAWQRFLRVRDLLRGRPRVLMIGADLAALSVLVNREGSVITLLDSMIDAFDGLLEELATEGSGGNHVLERLTQDALVRCSREARFDAIVVLDGHGFDLHTLLPRLGTALVPGGILLLAVPFEGGGGGIGGPVLPGPLTRSLPGFALERFGVSEGELEAVLVQGSATANLDAAALLEMTEDVAFREVAALAQAQARLATELEDTRQSLEEAERKAEELRESTSFRLGFAIVMAIRSPRSLLSLPATVVRLLRGKHKPTALAAHAKPSGGMTEWEKEKLRNDVRRVMGDGVDAIIAVVHAQMPGADPSRQAFACLVAAQACGASGRHDLEFEVASRALQINESVGMLRGFLHVSLRCRQMQTASDTLRRLHAAETAGNVIARRFLKQFRETSSYKIAVVEAIPPRLGPEIKGMEEGERFAYVLHNTLPYSSGGYATRSHGVAFGLLERGHQIVCLSRPGFPLDIKPELAPVDVPAVDTIDGVPYQRVLEPSRAGIPEYKYILDSADRMEEELRRLRPRLVQAASNYVTALPALIAARRLGVPFFYEVRGLWEITRMSRDQQFADSISFDVQRYLEATVAREADHVFTLTTPMKEELIERGVEGDRITLLPNSVDADRFQPSVRNLALAQQLDIPDGVPVIGYIGTFVIYEGLEHLVAACVRLHERGHDFRLVLVGNENASGQERGPITEEVLRTASEGGIADKLIMPGRIPHEEVESYYSLLDICPFPRKPWPVCEMVSPMKPLEALAMEKAVVVSSVRALTEMIADGETGLVFEKGNVDSLAETLERLILDPSLRKRLGTQGREWVARTRSWGQVADSIERVMAMFGAKLPGPM